VPAILPAPIDTHHKREDYQMNIFNHCKSTNGTINHLGTEYALLDDAVIDNDNGTGKTCFKCSAFSQAQLTDYCNEHGCADDNIDLSFATHAQLVWYPSEDWLKSDDTDNSNACDWAKPDKITIV